MEQTRRLLEVLADSGIDFVIVGGFAAVLHGSSQVTQDIDLCLSFSSDQIEKLRNCLAPFHPKHRVTPQRLSFLEHPENLSSLKNLYLETDLGVLDLLSLIGGVGDYEKVSQSAQEVMLYGRKFKLIGLEALIEAKKFMARPKDIATIHELECVRQNKKKLSAGGQTS